MSELKDNNKVVIIGAGPNVIGQSGECDEGAMEACRALSSAGCDVIIVNSNPDALMANPPGAENTYLEPLTIDTLRQVIKTQSPTALLPVFGGRESLHLVAQLSDDGTLDRQGIKILGPSAACIARLLDREALKSALSDIGLETPPIFTMHGIDAAVEKAQAIGFPVVLRCNDPDLMPDGILAYNQDELREKAARLPSETAHIYSVEASLQTWQQIELEILRDINGKSLVAGCVEYLDSAGIHPGDALAVCPPQSLSAKILKDLESHALAISDHLDIVGSATIRFAHDPSDERVLILAVHPRYTRTSAMVARAIGHPMGETTAMLAAGFNWKAIPERLIPAASEPAKTPVVAVKWPCWDFERLDDTVDRVGPQMQAVGQWIALGGSFKEALQKASRAATRTGDGLGGVQLDQYSAAELLSGMATPSSRRVQLACAALRKKVIKTDIIDRTQFSAWFVAQLNALIETELRLKANQGILPDDQLLRQAKGDGFGNDDLARLLQIPVRDLEQHLDKIDLKPRWCVQSASDSSRIFSTYNQTGEEKLETGKKKILIVGSGAHRIGQGPDCDYGVYRAAEAAREQGYTPTIVNCNLTSFTTGHVLPANCYCEPLTREDILAVIRHEQPIGVITQFAGLYAVDLSTMLSNEGISVMGTPIQTLQMLQHRNAFHEHMRQIGIPQPAAILTKSRNELGKAAQSIGFPMLIQPVADHSKNSTRVIRDTDALEICIEAKQIDPDEHLFVEQFMEYAIEAQADTLCDGTKTYVAAVMEHIELAGVHAGDSACITPPYSLAPRHIDTIGEYCQKIAVALEIHGLINLRFAIYRDTVYLLEASCRATRNLSMIEKTHQIPLTQMATRLMIGDVLDDLPMPVDTAPRVGLRAAVFPFNVFSAEDPLLGPIMRSTGQVLSTADSFGLAYFKALESAGTPLPTQGTVLITVTDEDKSSMLEPARIFQELGFSLMATKGTQTALAANGITVQTVRKLGFGRPDLVDEIKNGNVQMVINTPTGGQGQIDDSLIRKAAIQSRIANITTPASALAAAKGIAARRGGISKVD
jgi:carbamoyl-phosphate synthase large subunit